MSWYTWPTLDSSTYLRLERTWSLRVALQVRLCDESLNPIMCYIPPPTHFIRALLSVALTFQLMNLHIECSWRFHTFLRFEFDSAVHKYCWLRKTTAWNFSDSFFLVEEGSLEITRRRNKVCKIVTRKWTQWCSGRQFSGSVDPAVLLGSEQNVVT